MHIKKIVDEDVFEVLFTDDESILLSILIGSSYSGADQWTVPLKDYEAKFGITDDRADQLSTLTRKPYNEGISPTPILLNNKELRAIKKMIEHMMEKWDEGDFSTLAAAEKSEATALIEQFEKNGI